MTADSPAASAERPARAPDAPALAAWHAAWAVACAVAVLGAQLLGAPLTGGLSFGVMALVWPGLAGLLILMQDGPRERLLLLAGWTLAALMSAVLTGGLGGPLAAFAFMPLAAGIALGTLKRGVIGALGSAVVVLAGLSAALMGPPPMQSAVVSAVAALLTLAALAMALRLAWKTRENQLTRTEDATHRIEALLTALPSLTLVAEPLGRVLAAYGAPPPGIDVDALFEQGLVAAVHAPDRPALLSAIERALTGQDGVADFAPRTALDRRVAASVRRLDPAGAGERLAVQLHDGTAAWAREARADIARAEAEAQNAGKSRFLATMSHELRTPLNAVLGFSDIMRQRLFGPLPERYADYARSIHEAGGHLLDLINDVLDVSKIEADRYELNLESLDARECVSAAMTLVRLGADEKGVALNGVLPGEPVPVKADRRALKQIALNLLSNAVKFTPSGGAVTVTAEAIGPYLELVVADTGVGISPDDLKRLGRPFEQAGAVEQRAQGTGLGLSLARSLTELHGGRMTIESTLGAGTAVTVRLPIVEIAQAREGGAEIIQLRQ